MKGGGKGGAVASFSTLALLAVAAGILIFLFKKGYGFILRLVIILAILFLVVLAAVIIFSVYLYRKSEKEEIEKENQRLQQQWAEQEYVDAEEKTPAALPEKRPEEPAEDLQAVEEKISEVKENLENL